MPSATAASAGTDATPVGRKRREGNKKKWSIKHRSIKIWRNERKMKRKRRGGCGDKVTGKKEG